MMTDKTALSFWFPRLVSAGLPVPKTRILRMSDLAQGLVWEAFDGNGGTDTQVDAMNAFVIAIDSAARSIGGYPCFLRTDHTSGKHGWERTCFLSDRSKILHHIIAIAEYSEMAGFLGLPWDTWAVREMLPTIPLGACPKYGNMPLCREFRFFIDDDTIRCVHPYWPREALVQGGADVSVYAALSVDPDNFEEVHDIAKAAGKAVGGSWSVDVLETEGGWYITDMAEASKSFHWEGCPHVDK